MNRAGVASNVVIRRFVTASLKSLLKPLGVGWNLPSGYTFVYSFIYFIYSHSPLLSSPAFIPMHIYWRSGNDSSLLVAIITHTLRTICHLPFPVAVRQFNFVGYTIPSIAVAFLPYQIPDSIVNHCRIFRSSVME